MKNKILTIAIPTYNRKKELDIAFNSVLKQYNQMIEFIVCDNCSDDGTDILMKEYASKYEFVDYIRNCENIGSSNNFMKCFKSASCKFVLLLCDDDVLCEGALEKILLFLEENDDLSLGYLNQVFFRDKYISDKDCTEPYLNINTNIVTKDKNEFIKYAGMRITYTSSLIFNREAVLSIKNPEQFFKSRFLSASLAMITTSSNPKIGIIAYPCIAANLPSTVTNYNGFKLFGINVKKVLCGVGTKAGYDPKIMEGIYKQYVLPAYIKAIANAKINKYPKLWHDFKEYVWPAVKSYFGKREILLIAMCIPRFVWKPIRDIYSKKKYGK